MNLYNYLFTLVLFAGSLQRLAECRKTKNKEAKDRSENRGANENSLICPDCDRLFCTVRKASKLKCKGGKTTDICGCCPVCAKQVDEPCGGEWNYLGKCDAGLVCKSPSSTPLSALFYQPLKTEVPMRGIAEGTCVKIPNKGGNSKTVNDGSRSNNPSRVGHQPKCQAKCTPDFCLRNPRSICSAVDVVDMKRDCHGSCQHTSCQACSWVDPDPDCGACASDDIGCIKRFAKCIKRSYCTRSKFPCKSIAEKDHVGKFQCMVPKCLDKS